MKLRFLGCFVFLTFFSFSIFAQEPRSDSLLYALQKAKNDSNKVLIYYQLAWNFLASAPEKTKKFSQAGISLARKLGFHRGEILLLNRLGDYYNHQGFYARGIDYTTQSLKLAEKTKDSLGIADAYVLLSIIYFNGLKQYELAIQNNEKALHIYQQKKHKSGVASTYNLLARLYSITKQKPNLTHLYADRAIAMAKELHYTDFLGWCLNSKATIYQDEGKLDSALFYLEKSSQTFKEAKDKINVAINGVLIGNIYIRQNKYAEALATYQQNIQDAKMLNARNVLKDSYNGIANAYALQKQYDKAYEYLQLSSVLKDSIFDSETHQKIATFQAEYTEEKNEARIALLEKEKKHTQIEKRTYLTIAFIVFFALLLILFLISRNNHLKDQANRLLQEKNEEIALQNEELYQSREEIVAQRDIVAEQNNELQALNTTKDKLFSIIGHDLRSPINSLKGLMELVATENIDFEEFKSISGKLKNGVEHIHFTLNNLLLWAHSQMQGLQTHPQKINLCQLANQNIGFLSELAQNKHIQIQNLIQPDAQVWADIEHINLVFRNLISNAIKFTPQYGQIILNCSKEENFCKIVVIDTGKGINAENIAKLFHKSFHYTTYGTSGEKGTGLGLLLCQEMIEKDGGKIWVESEEDKGSSFYFTLPITS